MKQIAKNSNPVTAIPVPNRDRAIEMRKSATFAEKKLWAALRNRKLSQKFRRQHPYGLYILDFYCWEAHLVVEVDGDTHASAEAVKYDAERDSFLKSCGLAVMRFSNNEVLRNTDAVVNSIWHAMNPHTPL